MKNRRTVLKSLLLGLPLAMFARLLRAGPPTPPETEGPFYPLSAQKDRDFDLTRVEGRTGVAKGRVIIIQGRVMDTEGKPIEDATVDLWQANAAGRYRHPRDRNRAPLDPDFQGWAIVPSGREGGFRFKTIFPGTYPAAEHWLRPPHIHFKVTKSGYVRLVTQMYFPGQPLNDADLLLMQKSDAEAAQMIATRIPDSESAGLETYVYNIVLQQADAANAEARVEITS
ncbi:MAG: protocatechuate 3,4-dioxygenase [Gammaproteobacteria bacterium]|nr:protocatechuate 3,4-dioxygenase [Gammaproteobacteria bacterium]